MKQILLSYRAPSYQQGTRTVCEFPAAVSPEKSTVTLFTPATSEADIKPVAKGCRKQRVSSRKSQLLGVTYDTIFPFSQHVKDTVTKCKKKLNIMKTLVGSSKGKDKETPLITYKSIIRNALENANPIWSPMISATNWKCLLYIQNQAQVLIPEACQCLPSTISTGRLKFFRSKNNITSSQNNLLQHQFHAQVLPTQQGAEQHSTRHRSPRTRAVQESKMLAVQTQVWIQQNPEQLHVLSQICVLDVVSRPTIPITFSTAA